MPFGSDFQYTNATINYENMDRLMAYMNSHQHDYNMTLHWSTPREYMASIHATNRSWPLKTDDFESYAIGPDQYLVGFPKLLWLANFAHSKCAPLQLHLQESMPTKTAPR